MGVETSVIPDRPDDSTPTYALQGIGEDGLAVVLYAKLTPVFAPKKHPLGLFLSAEYTGISHSG